MAMFIDSNAVEGQIGILKAQTKIISDNFDLFKEQVSKLQYIWMGSSGTEAAERLTRHNATFDSIINQLSKNNEFLENANKTYIKAENEINKIIDENNSM